MKRSFLSIVFVLSFCVPALAVDPEQEELLRNVRVQVLLDQAWFSPGEIDGKFGANTENALWMFQHAQGLFTSGQPDETTMRLLSSRTIRTMRTYRISAEDLKGPFVSVPADYMEKAKLPHMGYTSALEAISEKFHMSPDLFSRLNPDATLKAGEVVLVPNVTTASARWKGEAPKVKPVSAGKKNPGQELKVIVYGVDMDLVVTRKGRVIFYAPISHGGDRDPMPVGKTTVRAVIPNPIYRYSPELFWDADPKHTKAVIRPGPNNPVGLVWIALNVKHYGLHGTPEPSAIGYGQSHGCIRMTNWDALRLATLVQPETEVFFSDHFQQRMDLQ